MPRVIAILNPSRRIRDRIVHAKLVAERLAAEPVFASPPVPLAVFEADIAALEEAEVRTLMGGLAAVPARNAKLAKVRSDLDALKSYVQSIADRSTAAAAIIQSAGMNVKRSSGHGKPDFAVRGGNISGSAVLACRAAKTRASYDWEYSPDGISWIRSDSTVRADTELFGLEVGTWYFFRHRVVTKEGVGDWSQVLSFFVR